MKTDKKAKLRKYICVLLIIAVAAIAAVIIFFAMLFHKPAYYKPADLTDTNEVSVYLTNQLLPELYNGAQLQEPFELVVTQSGVNDIVARYKWPQQFGDVKFSAPMVFFASGSIVLMGTVLFDGTEFVVTAVAKPALDADGLMNMNVASVKIGALDITPLAAIFAKEICRKRYEDKNLNKKDLWNKMTMSLLNGESFEPVFKIDDKKVRVEKITIEKKQLTVRLVPVPN